MDTQDFHNLKEAYNQVFENQLLNEKSYGSPGGGATSTSHDFRPGGPEKAPPAPQLPPPPTGRNPRKNQLPKPTLKNSADLFDIVKGHLIDEGFAETEEEALVIMSNMSEEWIQSIVEYNIPGFTPSAFKDFKQYPAVLNGKKGMVTGDEGAKGRAFRKDPKDYDRAVRQTNLNKRFGPLGPAVGSATRALGLSDDYQPEYADLFDVVKGYLIDECFAETEEAALFIMSNMSEEWMESIIEQKVYAPKVKVHAPGKPKDPAERQGATSRSGNNDQPDSSVSSPGYDTRRIGGYDLRRLPQFGRG